MLRYHLWATCYSDQSLARFCLFSAYRDSPQVDTRQLHLTARGKFLIEQRPLHLIARYRRGASHHAPAFEYAAEIFCQYELVCH